MATFLDYLILLFIGFTQAFSVYGVWIAIEKRKTESVEWEKILKENHDSDLQSFLAGKHHEDIEVISNRYMKDLSSAWKMQKRWYGKTPEILSFVYALFQLTLFVMFLEMDFGQAWR